MCSVCETPPVNAPHPGRCRATPLGPGAAEVGHAGSESVCLMDPGSTLFKRIDPGQKSRLNQGDRWTCRAVRKAASLPLRWTGNSWEQVNTPALPAMLARRFRVLVTSARSPPVLMRAPLRVRRQRSRFQGRELSRAARRAHAEQDLGGSDSSAPTRETALHRPSAASSRSHSLSHRTAAGSQGDGHQCP